MLKYIFKIATSVLLFSCRAFNAPFYIGVVIPFLIIYLLNWTIFVIIIGSLLHKNFSSKLKDIKTNKDMMSKSFMKQQLIIAITLSILFGLGWGLGLFVTEDIYTNKTVRDLFASLFVIFTAFHGLFIFIMHCLRSKDARNVWNKAFFGVTGREFNEFSLSTSNRVRGKSSGVKSTVARPPCEKSQSFTFSKKKSFSGFKHGGDGQANLREYTKKNEKELSGGVVGEKEVEVYPVYQNTECNFEEDVQGTLKFYIKKNKDLEPNLCTLNESSCNYRTKEEAKPVAKSFQDDKDDEKQKLREEKQKAHHAYHEK